jgi:hypothetical protein
LAIEGALGCNFIAINNAATCLGDVHNKLFISFDKVLNNSLPSGITYVILVGASIVLYPPTKAADL